jgi:hypothetical protein
VSRFIPAMTRYVIGLGHNTEDGKVTPIIFRKQVAPLSGSGSPTPQAGQSRTATGSPYPGNNPLPL